MLGVPGIEPLLLRLGVCPPSPLSLEPCVPLTVLPLRLRWPARSRQHHHVLYVRSYSLHGTRSCLHVSTVGSRSLTRCAHSCDPIRVWPGCLTERMHPLPTRLRCELRGRAHVRTHHSQPKSDAEATRARQQERNGRGVAGRGEPWGEGCRAEKKVMRCSNELNLKLERPEK